MKKMTSLAAQGSLIAFGLMLFSGCGLFKKSSSEQESASAAESKANESVLCSINGEPAIGESEFLSNLNQMIQSNPYFKGASIDSLPKELLRKFLDQLATQALIEKFSVKNNVEKDPEFVKAYAETEKLLKRSLMVQVFEKRIYDSLKVTDEDIAKHYAENRERFVKTPGGAMVAGVSFDKEEQAHAFYEKAKKNLSEFDALAKEAKSGKFREFGRVAKEARQQQFEFVPAQIKEAALSMHTFPGVEVVKAGKDYWVIKAWDKKDAEIFALEEIKPHIESMLKNNQFRDALDKRVKELKDEYKVTINDDYFKESAPKAASEKDADANENEKQESVAAAA